VLLGVAWVLALPAADGGPPPLGFVLQIWAVLLGLLAAATVAYLFAPVPVNATSLHGSVGRTTGSAGLAGSCEQRSGRHWHCDVADGHGSGQAGYEVEVDGTCWQARRSSPDRYTETPMPARAKGCARLRDQIALIG